MAASVSGLNVREALGQLLQRFGPRSFFDVVIDGDADIADHNGVAPRGRRV
jgi:hypothetical protein